jgi:three-Cys-motif partner protein
MDAALQPRNTQTQVKHQILEEYLIAWGGIIIHGVRRAAQKALSYGRPFRVHLVYVDGFAGCGRYAGDHSVLLTEPRSDIVFGSPIIGIRALDRLKPLAKRYGLDVTTNAILIERDNTRYQSLQQSLELADLRARIRQTHKLDTLTDGEIATLNGDFCALSGHIRAYTSGRSMFAFYLLDPWGPSGIPLDTVVAPIVRMDRTDVMINFPYQDLHKKAVRLLGQDEIPPRMESLIDHYDAMFGGREWREIAYEAASGADPEERSISVETALVDFYLDVLKKVDPELIPKSVRLRFPDIERTMFYLFLTTHDGTGALKLNQVLDNARLSEYELRQEYKVAKVIAKAREVGQLTMWDLEPAASPGASSRKGKAREEPEINKLAAEIYERFAGQSVQFGQVIREFADSPYYHSDMKKAMTHLKRGKKVTYSRLRNQEPVTFCSKDSD